MTDIYLTSVDRSITVEDLIQIKLMTDGEITMKNRVPAMIAFKAHTGWGFKWAVEAVNECIEKGYLK